LPRLPLFFAQRAAEVGHHEQKMRHALFAKRRAANAKASVSAGQQDFGGKRFVAAEKGLEAEVLRGARVQLFGGTPEETLAGAIDETEPPLIVEREDRGVDLLDDGSHERGRFDLAEAARAQRVGQQ